jgi:hypothetical protein
MTAVCGTVDVEWRPYDSRGVPRSRVKEFVTRGTVEYEQCVEGGSYVIRRTERDRTGEMIRITETGRGLTRRDALDLWKLIVMGHRPPAR